MRLLVTRPEPEAGRTAERLQALGHEVTIASLLEAEWLNPPRLAREPAALLFTSANAVRAVRSWPDIAMLRAKPAFCVGDRTAEMARDAGFEDVRSAEGDGAELGRLVRESLQPASGSLLYPAGADRAGDLKAELSGAGFEVELVEAYRMRPADALRPAVADAIAGGRIDGILVYSRRTAEALKRLAARQGLETALRTVPVFALSPNIAATLRPGRVHVAVAPTEAALVAAVEEYALQQASADGLLYSETGGEVEPKHMADQDNTHPEADRLAGKRRKRPPVTIDLEAEPAATKPLDPGTSDARPPETAAAEFEAAAANTAERLALDPETAIDSGPIAGTTPLPETPREADPEVDQLPPAVDARRAGVAAWIAPVAAAVGGGVIGGLLVAFLTAPPTDTITNASVDTRIETLSARIDKLEAARSESAGGTNNARLDALSADIEALKSAAPAASGATPDLSPIENRLAALEQKQAPAADLSPVQAKLDELAGRVAEIEAHPAVDPKTQTAATVIALTALRQAASGSGPFEAELTAAGALGTDAAVLSALAAEAKTGAPSLADLRASFPAVADKIRAAAAKIDPEAGFLDRLAASAGSLVSVKPAGPVDGPSATAIVSRMEADVQKGDIAAALKEGEALDAAARAPFSEWADGARRRLAVDTALASLAAPGSTN